MSYSALADAVLLFHFGVVVFVVGGLLAIPLGNWRRWRWVNGWPFRLVHAGAVGVIVVQAWLGQHCPLTVLEVWLREQAGAAHGYQVGFVQYWVQRLIYFEAPVELFAVLYTAFAAAVAAVWWRYPPRAKGGTAGRD